MRGGVVATFIASIGALSVAGPAAASDFANPEILDALAYAVKRGHLDEAAAYQPVVRKKNDSEMGGDGSIKDWSFKDFRADVSDCFINQVVKLDRSDIEVGYWFEWFCLAPEGETRSDYKVEADVFLASNSLNIVSTGRVIIPPVIRMKN